MKPLAATSLVLACVWAGATFPILALAALLVFAALGATYEILRTTK